MTKKSQQFQLEDSINKLNEIVSNLESGELSLEESLKLYEEGMRISHECNEYLDHAEQKITDLSKGKKDEDT